MHGGHDRTQRHRGVSGGRVVHLDTPMRRAVREARDQVERMRAVLRRAVELFDAGRTLEARTLLERTAHVRFGALPEEAGDDGD